MTFKKALFIKGFMIVVKINRLLLYQAFKELFLKKHLSDSDKNFLWGIIHLLLSERYF